MTTSSLRSALEQFAGSPQKQTSDETTAWDRCLAELLGGSDVRQQVTDLSLDTPGACAAASTGTLMSALEKIPRGPQKATVLQRFATWWVERFGDDCQPEWNRSVEDERLALRALRGLGPETVDRLLLFGAGLPVMPIDRATLRVLVRHGWLDLPVSDEEAQSTLLAAAGPDIAGLQHATRWLQAVGAKYCGRVPDCAACPLQPTLPASGPLHPESC